MHAALGDPARLAIVDMLTLGDTSPGEVGRLLGIPSNLVAHHLKVLQDVGLTERTRSEGDRRRTYLRLVPQALAGLTPPSLQRPPRLVFVCTQNSARSQLAAALWARCSVFRPPLPGPNRRTAYTLAPSGSPAGMACASTRPARPTSLM